MFFISICFGPIRFYGQSYAPTDAVAKAKSHSNFIQRRTDGYSKVRANGDTKTYDGSLRGNRHSAFVHPPVKKPAFVRNGSLEQVLEGNNRIAAKSLLNVNAKRRRTKQICKKMKPDWGKQCRVVPFRQTGRFSPERKPPVFCLLGRTPNPP